MKDFRLYLLQIDESKDLSASIQLCIFTKGIDKNFNSSEVQYLKLL